MRIKHLFDYANTTIVEGAGKSITVWSGESYLEKLKEAKETILKLEAEEEKHGLLQI